MKLLSEVQFLGADKVEFKLTDSEVLGSIVKEGRGVKSLTVKPHWFSPMFTWLERRTNPIGWGDQVPPAAPRYVALPVSVKCADQVVSLLAEKNTNLNRVTTLTLSRFVSKSWSQAVDAFGVSPQNRQWFEQVCSPGEGAFIAVTREDGEKTKRIAPALIYSGAGYLGDLADASVRAFLLAHGSPGAVVVSIVADDPTDALIKMRAYGISLEKIQFKGCMESAFVRRVCSHCAKKSDIDVQLLSALPEHLTQLNTERYSIGRGCAQCGQQGYLGSIGLQSIAPASQIVCQVYDRGGTQVDLAAVLVPRGLKPLLEDGFLKAIEGLTTVESLFQISRIVPVVYTEYWKHHARHSLSHQQMQEDQKQENLTTTPTVDGDTAPMFTAEQLGKKREKPLVLVVEDDDDQRAILEMVLRAADYDVAQAINGKDALDSVQRQLPDLIIADLMMPVMDGSHMVSALKRQPQFSHVPILMLTMIADEEREYALLNLGADDYCEKTIQRKVLLKRIENLIKRSRGGAYPAGTK
jgi:CheY-like chemotaxis protein